MIVPVSCPPRSFASLVGSDDITSVSRVQLLVNDVLAPVSSFFYGRARCGLHCAEGRSFRVPAEFVVHDGAEAISVDVSPNRDGVLG